MGCMCCVYYLSQNDYTVAAMIITSAQGRNTDRRDTKREFHTKEVTVTVEDIHLI